MLHNSMGEVPLPPWAHGTGTHGGLGFFATDLVTNGILGLEKSVDDVLAACESAEELESTLRTFLDKCKKHML